MISDNHVNKVTAQGYDWKKDRRRKYPPIVKTCRCGKVFMPDQSDARKYPDREFFCSPDCYYDSITIERKNTHCKACGKPLTKTNRKPESSCCNQRCGAVWSHTRRSAESYKHKARRKDVVEFPASLECQAVL